MLVHVSCFFAQGTTSFHELIICLSIAVSQTRIVATQPGKWAYSSVPVISPPSPPTPSTRTMTDPGDPVELLFCDHLPMDPYRKSWLWWTSWNLVSQNPWSLPALPTQIERLFQEQIYCPMQSIPRESNDKEVAIMLDELTTEANEESFVIILQHGGNDITWKWSIVWFWFSHCLLHSLFFSGSWSAMWESWAWVRSEGLRALLARIEEERLGTRQVFSHTAV